MVDASLRCPYRAGAHLKLVSIDFIDVIPIPNSAHLIGGLFFKAKVPFQIATRFDARLSRFVGSGRASGLTGMIVAGATFGAQKTDR
jgi:hypothetical protein